MLDHYTRRNGFPNPTYFTDNGISGTRLTEPPDCCAKVRRFRLFHASLPLSLPAESAGGTESHGGTEGAHGAYQTPEGTGASGQIPL